MQRRSPIRILLAALVLAGAAACDSANDPEVLITEDEVTADLAAVSGDAIADEVIDLVANEAFAGFGAPPAVPTVDVERTRTCFDQNHVAQAACDPQTTASVELTVTREGNFARQHTGPRGTETVIGAIHQARELTISGLFGTETQRTHDGSGTSRDTITMTASTEDVDWSRRVAVASDDTVSAVVFQLPHASNPWPVSGTIIRNKSGTIEVTVSGPNGDREETRTFARRVQVTFPADAQGNVAIQINDRTCNLNLVTRRITGCE